MDCDLKLWSWKTVNRQGDNITPVRCGHVNAAAYVSYIDRLKNDYKFVTASKKGHIDVFDYGLAEVTADLHIPTGSRVSGIAAHPTSSKNWVTCSLDRSCVLWDRTSYPAKAAPLLRDYENQLTSVYWTTQEENREFLVVGDEVGNLLVLDPRSPNKILQKIQVTTRGISQISFKGSKQFGVIAGSNIVGILDIGPDGELSVAHKHVSAFMHYAMRWDDQDEKTFYVVGEKQFAEKVTLG